MKKFKSFLSLAVLVAISFGLSGCGEGCKDCQSMLENNQISKIA